MAVQEQVFEGELCEFQIRSDLPKRRFTTVNVTFGMARQFFKIQPYDPVKGTGEQRERIDSHVKKLQRAFQSGTYTPAPLAVGVRDSHLDSVHIDEKKRKVRITVSEVNPLALLDGGHRFASLTDMRATADVDGQKKIDSVMLTFVIHLDPEYIRKDFANLQAGKSVSRSLMKVMEEQGELNPDDKNTPTRRLTRQLAGILNSLPENESFLHNDINFTKTGGGKVEYASITTLSGSDLGTSLSGGARIALFPQFWMDVFKQDETKARDFLVECYKAVWQGIWKYDEVHEFKHAMTGQDEKCPQLIMNDRMLRPNRTGGTKGGTGLLIMLGNMLAFRTLAYHRKAEINQADVKRLVESAQQVLDTSVQGGGSGPAKRMNTREFVVEYFDDIVRQGEGDEHDARKLGAIHGVPVILCDQILTRSTLAVQKKSKDAIDDHNYNPPRMSDPDQTTPDWEETKPDGGPIDNAEEIGNIEGSEGFEPPPPSPAKRGRKPAAVMS